VFAQIGFWKERQYHLDKMTLNELVKAFFQYYAIQAYLVAGVIATYYAITLHVSVLMSLLAAVIAVVVYPLAWYILHRFVLHGNYLYKNPVTAALWKRIHYDHHQDPYDLSILFGALYTTMPTIAAVTLPIGHYLDGWGGAASAFAAGMFFTCINEFCHCIMHLSYKPKNKYLRKIKALHLIHHFHNEKANYGITNYEWDRLFGNYYPDQTQLDKSPTVFDLGYTAEMAEKYPWVSKLSGGVSHNGPRERRKAVQKP